MTITTAAAPSRQRTAVALARGFLTGGVVGASLAAFVVGIVLERVPLVITGIGLPVVYGLLLLLAGRAATRPGRGRRTAHGAREDREPVGQEDRGHRRAGALRPHRRAGRRARVPRRVHPGHPRR